MCCEIVWSALYDTNFFFCYKRCVPLQSALMVLGKICYECSVALRSALVILKKSVINVV